MQISDLEITVYYDSESPELMRLVRELDDLDVAYDEWRLEEAPESVRGRIEAAGASGQVSPVVSINGEILVRPTAANVMSAIMHARSAGFYQ